MSFYHTYLYGLLALFAVALFRKFTQAAPKANDNNTDDAKVPVHKDFKTFQYKFLLVYLVMMAADWMQGPYVYELYSYYGFSRTDNGILFIAGFGSSLVFGTWAGPIADRYGRKLTCLLYGVAYILSCMTKHFPDFNILMIGRVLGGFATSILWSSFESWMVAEHNNRGYPPELIGSTFSLMFTWNGIVAIASGFVAQWSVYAYGGHPVAPFDVSALLLAIGSLFIFFTWGENYGDQSHNMIGQFKEALTVVRQDRRVFLVGLQQSLFEGAMYTFVFMWTPTLSSPEGIPHGLIFACFMIASGLGGSVFGLLEGRLAIPQVMQLVFGAASFSMAIPVVSSSHQLIMGGFILFEIAVGIFWPGIGTLRSKYVPESCRATVINVFRIPLNFVVCCVLYFQGQLNVWHVFVICSLFHGLAAAAATLLARMGEPSTHTDTDSS